MTLRLLSFVVALLLPVLAGGLAEAYQQEQGDLRTTSALLNFGCPAAYKGLNLVTSDTTVNRQQQPSTSQATFTYLCRYSGPAGTAEWMVKWDASPVAAPTPCGIPESRSTGAIDRPYAFVYSQSKSAYLYVAGVVGTLDEMIAAGRPHLQEAEAKAPACKPSLLRCPANFNAVPFYIQTTDNGSIRELIPGSGTWSFQCNYARDGVGGVRLQVLWRDKYDAAYKLCGQASKGTGLREDYVEYSKTREVSLTVTVRPGRDINVYPATLNEVLAVGRPMLATAETQAAACTGPAAGAPQAAVATPPQPRPAGPSIAGAPPDANVLPDEAYQDPVASDDGLVARVLEPGSALPGDGDAAAAAAAAAIGAAAVGASELSRTRRRPSPIEGMATGVIRERVTQMGQDEARDVLRRVLPKAPVDQFDDPIGVLTALTTAAANPQNLGRTLRETLVREPRAAEALLNRIGMKTPWIAIAGGPGRVVKTISRIVRNPPRAIAEGFKDAIHNITHPKDMFRHVKNGLVRLGEATPVGPLVRLVKGLFRRRRGPRPNTPGGVSTQRVSDARPVPQESLLTERPEPMEDPYPKTAGDTPGSPR